MAQPQPNDAAIRSEDHSLSPSSILSESEEEYEISRTTSILLIPSSDISEDSETLLKLLPHNFFNETLQNENIESNANAQVIKSNLSDDDVVIFHQISDKSVNASAHTTANIPDACIVVTKAELDSLIKIGAKLTNVSMRINSSQTGISSTSVKMPGGSTIFFASQSIGSSSALASHLLSCTFQSKKQLVHTKPLSKPTKQSWNDEKIPEDVLISNRITPTFPTLDVKLMQQTNSQTRFVPMTPNALKEANVETDLLSGKIMLILRPENPDDDTYFYERIFKGRRRRFEIQFQFKLKRLPVGNLYCGGEMDGYLKLGLVARGVVNLVLKLLRKLTRNLYYSFGTKDRSENARIVFPLHTYVDRVVTTKPGEEPPKLGNILYESPESYAHRKSSKTEWIWSLENTYTMSFNSSNVDLPTWNLVNVPMVPDTDLHLFWGDSSIAVVVYDIPGVIGQTKHITKILNYGMSMQIAYVGGDDQVVSVETYDSYSTDAEENASYLTKRSIDEEISDEICDDETCVYFDAFETELDMYAQGKNGIDQPLSNGNKLYDLFCSAWIDMYQPKEKRYVTLYAFLIEDSIVFHSFSQFSRFFSVKDKHKYRNNSKYSRLSKLERRRRFMGSYIASLSCNDNQRLRLKEFCNKTSNFSTKFLNHRMIPSSLSGEKPILQTYASRALSENHWREEWVIFTNRHISFYDPDQKKHQHRISLSTITGVKKLTPEIAPHFPNFHFIEIETLARCTYMMVSDERKTDEWIQTIFSMIENYARNRRSNQSIYYPSNEYMHKSSMWEMKKRQILNCRRLIFHPFTRKKAIIEDPCKLSEDILHKVLTLSEDSEESLRDFLDSTSEFKAVDVSALDEEERLTFFLNLYHIMVMHAMLVLSPPTTTLKFTSFFNAITYQCSDDIFSIAELEHCIIRKQMSSPSRFISKWIIPKSVYPFALNISDIRLIFALNCGSRSNPSHIPIYKRSILDAQLNFVVKLSLEKSAKISFRYPSSKNLLSKANSKTYVVELPRVCDWFMDDFGCKRSSDLVRILSPFFSEDMKKQLGNFFEKRQDKNGNGETSNISVRFQSFDFTCQELFLLEEGPTSQIASIK